MTSAESPLVSSSPEPGPPGPVPPPTARTARDGVIGELRHHLPYSVFGVLLALVVVGALGELAKLTPDHYETLFHFLHPAHLLLSTTATTAMVSIYGGGAWRAGIIGILGSGPLCTTSDILIPYLGGRMLGQEMDIHICLVEEPGMIVPFLLVGVVVGLVAPRYVDRTTTYSHGGHVLVSAGASLLYLVSFGLPLSVVTLGPVLLLLVVAVMLPCCLSDIVVPVALVRAPHHERHRH